MNIYASRTTTFSCTPRRTLTVTKCGLIDDIKKRVPDGVKRRIRVFEKLNGRLATCGLATGLVVDAVRHVPISEQVTAESVAVVLATNLLWTVLFRDHEGYEEADLQPEFDVTRPAMVLFLLAYLFHV